MEYTKGKWMVNEVHRCIHTHDADIPLFAICYFGNHELERKNIANANLMAKAPRMYKALESIAYAQNLIGAQQIARQVLGEMESLTPNIKEVT